MLAFYTAMLHLRNEHSSIATGRYVAPRVDGRTMSFQRTDAHEHTVVVINYGETAGAARLAGLPANAHLQRLHPAAPGGDATAAAAGTLDIPASALVGAGVSRVATDTARTSASNTGPPARLLTGLSARQVKFF